MLNWKFALSHDFDVMISLSVLARHNVSTMEKWSNHVLISVDSIFWYQQISWHKKIKVKKFKNSGRNWHLKKVDKDRKLNIMFRLYNTFIHNTTTRYIKCINGSLYLLVLYPSRKCTGSPEQRMHGIFCAFILIWNLFFVGDYTAFSGYSWLYTQYITPGGFQGTLWVLGTKYRPVVCKAKELPIVLFFLAPSLWNF